MTFVTKNKIFSKQWLINYTLIVAGSLAFAVGLMMFVVPNKLVLSGVYGISAILHYLFGTPVGLIGLLIDIPLVIVGIRLLGPRFGYKTVVGFVLTAFFIDCLAFYYGEQSLVADQFLLSAIFGGVFLGLGRGLILKSKASYGGTNIFSMILSKYTRFPIGKLMIYVDFVMLLISFLIFQDWKIPMYSLIVILVSSKVVDSVVQGFNYDKTLFIVSDRFEDIRDKILYDLNRSGTFIEGEGMYNSINKTVIFTVVNRREMAILQDYIHRIDPKAFVTVIDANEILGEGFKSLNDKS